MIERLQRVLQHIDEVSPEQQDEIAAIIEGAFAPSLHLPSYAGAIAGMLPDDAEEEMLQRRREVPPSASRIDTEFA